jgi:putative tryptophan/tyrosine transport system substrate-binding protein
MNRRRFLLTSVAGGLAMPLTAAGERAGKMYRIGVLDAVDEASNAANLTAFRLALRDLGYVEGHNAVIEYRSADGRPERFRNLAVELVALQPDVIVTRGDSAALAAKMATEMVPVVMASSGDPAAAGIVASLAKPGRNITGLHMLAPVEVAGHRLRILKELVPRVTRVGVLWNPGTHHTPLLMRETVKVASTMGVQLHSFELRAPGNLRFDRPLEEAALSPIGALITMEDSLALAQRALMVEFASMSRLPAIYGLREFVEAGGLVAYGPDRRDMFRRAAGYVHRIFTGASPADLSVEPPTRFELVINLKTAKALGLTIPPSLLLRADQVID